MQLTKSQSKTAKLLRISFDQVHRVMQKFVDRGLTNRSLDDRYYYLSIDEKAVQRGHEYISVLSDESTGVVIDVIEGRTKESVDKLCQKLTVAQRKEVKTICIKGLKCLKVIFFLILLMRFPNWGICLLFFYRCLI